MKDEGRGSWKTGAADRVLVSLGVLHGDSFVPSLILHPFLQRPRRPHVAVHPRIADDLARLRVPGDLPLRRTARSHSRLIVSLRTAWSNGADGRLARLHAVDEVLVCRGLSIKCTSFGPIFEVSSDFGSASMPPRRMRTQPSGPMNFVESLPGLKVIFTPSPNLDLHVPVINRIVEPSVGILPVPSTVIGPAMSASLPQTMMSNGWAPQPPR